MPLRLLPNLWKNLQNALSKPQPETSGDTAKIEEKSLNMGPLDLPKFSRVSELNFLLSDDTFNISTDKEERIIESFRFFSYLILIIFSFFALIGMLLTFKLNTQQVESNELIRSIEIYTPQVPKAQDVNKKTEYYKHIYQQRNVMGEKAKWVFSVPAARSRILTALISDSKFNITFEVSSALDFASIVSGYLESKLISELSISSAELNTSNGFYIVSLEGVLL